MFFVLSKIGWYLLQPLAVVLALLVLSAVLSRLAWRRTARVAFWSATLFLALAALSPAGLLMMAFLENRVPPAVLPQEAAGIVVLGGGFDTRVARTRGVPELNEAADRLTAGLALARRYPQARVLFSGGVAALLEEDMPETEAARRLYADLGLEPSRLLLEDRARNTYENAVEAKALAAPRPGETWLLVTSAYHMPRAVGCFRVAGFDVLPVPVDYRTPAGAAVYRPSSTTTRNLEKVHFALREFIGLATYYATGRTDAWIPGP
ncbi:YdcF family protein [Aurantimonas sp. Leaf443]|uniref:YdcF family protein n=1 Tax=Aurantimonas sp. Leaf443 TaxID=1736378 RepID=UPI0007008C89|nr:YdcF family protein [Aurantimonas sp. Leaf443]KQT83534.1 hypothetical protein ASG48_13410 [Aurantimonas sp. Leaf443]